MIKIFCIALLLLTKQFANAQVGIGTATPNSNAILDLTSSKRALLLPRVASTTAIVAPVNGMIIYDLSSNCYKVFQKGAWTGCGLIELPSIATLDCSADISPNVAKKSLVYSGTTIFSYTGGNGASYSSESYVSSGVTGLTLTLNAGILAIGTGTLTYTCTGIPSSVGTATFNISFLGKTCTKSLVVYACGAYVASGVYKEFMCHNLGADITLDPDVPVQGIAGNYYQWGRSTVVANASTSAGAISGWNTIAAANGSWSDTGKTANDPCPAGYRVPTKVQWDGVINSSLNTRTFRGSFLNDGNFTSAISFGPNATTTSITLPAAGSRGYTAGSLSDRGNNGFYWSSTKNGSDGYYLNFFINNSFTTSYYSTCGFSVRCISE